MDFDADPGDGMGDDLGAGDDDQMEFDDAPEDDEEDDFDLDDLGTEREKK
jgi:hypothetical protein